MEITQLFAAGHIRTVFRSDGAAVLLDLKTLKLTMLSPEAGLVWEHLLRNMTSADIVKAMIEEFDFDDEDLVDLDAETLVGQEVTRGLEDLLGLGLLATVKSPIPSAEIVAEPDTARPIDMVENPTDDQVEIRYLLLAALVYLPALAMSCLPWDRLERFVRCVRHIMPNPPGYGTAAGYVRASRKLARFVPERKLCFETANSTFLMGLLLGHPPTWCVGLRFGRGIEMHAWSEDEHGMPVLETIMEMTPYGAFMRI